MTVQQIADIFKEKEYMLNMGAGKLSKWLRCSKGDIYKAKDIARGNNKKFPKILIFDIETSPLRAYVWSRWKQNIYLDQTISEWFMLTWSAKWLYSTEIMSDKLTGKEVLKEDDSRIVEKLWKLVDEADIIIAHNGEKFDTPKMNSRFLLNGLNPTSPYQQIDTKKVAAKQFGFSSNKMDALARYFGIDVKLDTDFELWAKCMQGDEEALEYMRVYNVKDVEILEEVYLRLRPWIKSHPNVGLYMDSDKPVCASCGSEDLKEVPNKFYHTSVSKFQVYRCKCGALTRGRKNVQDNEIKRALLTTTAR